MDVEVDQPSAKGPLQSLAESVLGRGMLERARKLSLALLGATAALGLSMLALIFNQGWPLVAGGPLPPLPPRHQEVAKAQIAAPAPNWSADEKASQTARSSSGRASSNDGPTPVSSGDPTPQGASELAVVHSAPVKQAGAPHGDRPKSPGGKPARPQPSPPAPPATRTPTTSPKTQPTPVSQPQPQPESPPATVSEAPPESSLPEWSHGKGHAYGRTSESSTSASPEADVDDDDAHGRAYGHDD
jgi:hypothetical protein